MHCSNSENTPACDPAGTAADALPTLRIPVLLWLRMVRDLRRRGRGRRESGAFLLGTRGGSVHRAREYVCYDDLDPRALDTGICIVRPCGFKALWARCRERGVEVLADVHTHGGDDTRQSETDRTNPMMSKAGHVALILPRFAGTWGWRFRKISVYEYAGNYGWKNWTGGDRKRRVRISLW